MKKSFRFSMSLIALSLCSVAFAFAQSNQNETTLFHGDSIGIQLLSKPQPTPKPPHTTLPAEDLRLFIEIFDGLKKNYVEEVSDQALIHNAIKGMLTNLDPHSKYYSAEEFQRIKNQTSGSFAGIGIEATFNRDKKGLIVQRIFQYSPASESDIMPNDVIINIDGLPVIDLGAKQAGAKLQGKVGSSVTLNILRGETPIELTIIRDNIKTPSLSTSALYNNEFAYIRLDRFQKESDKEIMNALAELETQAQTNDATLQGVILDLRDNAGGLLNASVEVADLFLDQGVITYTEGQASKHQKRFTANAGDIIQDIPLIILINSQTASGAEIVAGALQDHQRAVIVGETSYGKGSVQYAVGLKNGQAIRYTVARYYTPKGRSIQNSGITPDIIIPGIKASVTKNHQRREVNNKGHLDNTTANHSALRAPADFSNLLEQDYALYEGLNLLRAMSTLSPRPIPQTKSIEMISEQLPAMTLEAQSEAVDIQPSVEDSKADTSKSDHAQTQKSESAD